MPSKNGWVQVTGGKEGASVWFLYRDGRVAAKVEQFHKGAPYYPNAVLPQETARAGAVSTLSEAKKWAQRAADFGDTGHVAAIEEYGRKLERGDYLMMGFVEGLRYAAKLMPELEETLKVVEDVPIRDGVVVKSIPFSAEIQLRGPRGCAIGKLIGP